MKKYIILLAILLTGLSLFAQYDSLWIKLYGGANSEYCYSIAMTKDEYCLLFGNRDSDFWLVKTDMNGDTIWTKSYGGGSPEEPRGIIETSDSSYLMTGSTMSYGNGVFDYWVVKTSSNGDTLWTKTYGGAGDDRGMAVLETYDGYYMIGGHSYTYGPGSADFWLIKANAAGDTLWTKTYGGTSAEYLDGILETSDSCYLLYGTTHSFGAGSGDAWIVKINSDGDTLWTKTYGGVDDEECTGVVEMEDSSFIFVGCTNSDSADGWDMRIVNIDTNGDTIWTKLYGGSGNEYAQDIARTEDNDIVLAAYSSSFGTDFDIWFFKADAKGDTICTRAFVETGNDIAVSVRIAPDGTYYIGGYTQGYGANGTDFYLMKLIDDHITNFSIIPLNPYIGPSGILYWHSAVSIYPVTYEISINSVIDTVSDTIYMYENYNEGPFIWSVTGFNAVGTRQLSDNIDTCMIDTTSPRLRSIELIPDTNFIGPYELRLIAEDTIAGLDSIIIHYTLPGDTAWGAVRMNHEGGLFYNGYIPAVNQTGYVYYYVQMYDKTVPSNKCIYPAYPDLYSFRVTGLTGTDMKPEMTYSIHYKQLSNTAISMALPNESPVTVTVYDASGRMVVNRSLYMPAGEHSVNLDIIPGVYFIKVHTIFGDAEGKLIKIK